MLALLLLRPVRRAGAVVRLLRACKSTETEAGRRGMQKTTAALLMATHATQAEKQTQRARIQKPLQITMLVTESTMCNLLRTLNARSEQLG